MECGSYPHFLSAGVLASPRVVYSVPTFLLSSNMAVSLTNAEERKLELFWSQTEGSHEATEQARNLI